MLRERMRRAQVNETDIDETFVFSSGPGGQSVNKVSSCVCLVHRLCGIRIKCQKTRSQKFNRLLARQWLLEEIERRKQKSIISEHQRLAKEKRQKRKRPAYLQEEIFNTKRLQSHKKFDRRKISLVRNFRNPSSITKWTFKRWNIFYCIKNLDKKDGVCYLSSTLNWSLKAISSKVLIPSQVILWRVWSWLRVNAGGVD